MSFETLGLSQPVLRALYKTATEEQPLVLAPRRQPRQAVHVAELHGETHAAATEQQEPALRHLAQRGENILQRIVRTKRDEVREAGAYYKQEIKDLGSHLKKAARKAASTKATA